MDHNFDDFHFNSEQLVLRKNDEVIHLRLNESKLLALLISDPQRVFSKQDIFDNVWAGKIVSEQNIFQNIGNLRTILGENAILTHTKKGYQWNLTLDKNSPSLNEVAQTSLFTQVSRARNKTLFALFALVCAITFFVFMQSLGTPTKNKPIRLAYTPTSIDQQSITQLSELSSKPFDVGVITSAFTQIENLQAESLALKPNTDLSSLGFNEKLALANKENSDISVVYDSRVQPLAQGVLLSFAIQTKDMTYHGEIFGRSLDEVIQKNKQHLNNVINSPFFSLDKSNAEQLTSAFKSAYQKYPTDINLLYLFAKYAIKSNQLELAQVLVEELEKLAQQDNLYFLARTFQLSSRLFLNKEEYEKAQVAASDAQHIYKLIGYQAGVAEAKEQAGKINFVEGNLSGIDQKLLQATAYYAENNDYENQFEGLLNLAMMAGQVKQFAKRDDFMSQAQQLLKSSDLPVKCSAQFLLQKGVFSERRRDFRMAEKSYKDVIALYEPKQKNELKRIAQQRLTGLLSRSNRLEDAVAVFSNEGELTSYEKVMLARIYLDSQKAKLAIPIAQQAYRDSLLTGDVDTSLEAALVLVQLSELDQQLTVQSYSDYIMNNATLRFKRRNKYHLEKAQLYAQLDIGNE